MPDDIKMAAVVDVIKRRRSCRSYDGVPLDEEKGAALRSFLSESTTGPFGNRLRFLLVERLGRAAIAETTIPGTYGVIQGAEAYIVGAVKAGARAVTGVGAGAGAKAGEYSTTGGTLMTGSGLMEDYGYVLEKIILFAAAIGLGTCWLGGTFQRSGFRRLIDLQEGELLPAVTPVGYPREKRSLTDRMFRFMAASDKRKPWEELFFRGDLQTPLTREQAGAYGEVLECVRLGPSASNRQPWRIIKTADCDQYSLYLQRTPGYGRLPGGISLQNIDMGIAMCHFELAARALGRQGRWVRLGQGAGCQKPEPLEILDMPAAEETEKTPKTMKTTGAMEAPKKMKTPERREKSESGGEGGSSMPAANGMEYIVTWIEIYNGQLRPAL